MKLEKILNALVSAGEHLRKSIESFKEKDEKAIIDSIWLAASDLEYSLFLFSLIHQDETLDSSWKLDPPARKFELGHTLELARNLIGDARARFEASDLLAAYEKTTIARIHLLRVHEFFEKKRNQHS